MQQHQPTSKDNSKPERAPNRIDNKRNNEVILDDDIIEKINETHGNEKEVDDLIHYVGQQPLSGYVPQPVPPVPPPPSIPPPPKDDEYEDSLDRMQFQYLSNEINQAEDNLEDDVTTKGGPWLRSK